MGLLKTKFDRQGTGAVERTTLPLTRITAND